MRYIILAFLLFAACNDTDTGIVPSEVKMTPICAVAWQADGVVLKERNCHFERETKGWYRLTVDRKVNASNVIVQVMPDSPAYPNYSFYGCDVDGNCQEDLIFVQMVSSYSGMLDTLDSGGNLVVYLLE